MATLISGFLTYLKAVFAEGQRLVFTVFDIIGIVLFFFPDVAGSLASNESTVRVIGGLIFFVSFLLANFMVFRKMAQVDHLLLLYPHRTATSNAVKMRYQGPERLKNLNVQIIYKDPRGHEIRKKVKQFFLENDPQMIVAAFENKSLDPGQIMYFHLLKAEDVLDGKAMISVDCVGERTNKSVKTRK